MTDAPNSQSAIRYNNEFSDFVGRTLLISERLLNVAGKYDVLTPVPRSEADNTLERRIIVSTATVRGVTLAARWDTITSIMEAGSLFQPVDIAGFYRGDGEENLTLGLSWCELRAAYLAQILAEGTKPNPFAHTQYIANMIWAKRFMESYRLWAQSHGLSS